MDTGDPRPRDRGVFLRTYGGLVGRKGVHRLLNERVLEPARNSSLPHLKRLPEDG